MKKWVKKTWRDNIKCKSPREKSHQWHVNKRWDFPYEGSTQFGLERVTRSSLTTRLVPEAFGKHLKTHEWRWSETWDRNDLNERWSIERQTSQNGHGVIKTRKPHYHEGSIRSSVKPVSTDGRWTQSSRPASVTSQHFPVQSQVRWPSLQLGHQALQVTLSESADLLCSFAPCPTFPHWAPIPQSFSCLFVEFWLPEDRGPWLIQLRLSGSREWMSLTPLCLNFPICGGMEEMATVGPGEKPREGLEGSGQGFTGDPQPPMMTPRPAQRAKWFTQTVDRKTEFSGRNLSS